MSTASSAIKTTIFTLCVPLVVAAWIPQRMLAGSHDGGARSIATDVVGGLLLVLGAIGYFWCAALFVKAQGTPAPIFPTERTVMSGPYRINRNPMYSSVLAVVFGQAVFYRQANVGVYGLFLAACFHSFVMFYEEPTLRAQFDGEYEEFCRRVPRWIPRVGVASRR
jgi:protein-S-isoprenylcysteine O-methyltransferase Ste14